MQDTGAHSNAYRDDEIDLRELIKGLWAQKVLISSVTALVAASALAYVLLATPVYETKATVLPPLLSDIAPYNVGRREASLTLFSTENVYTVFTRSLYSQSLARGFFREVYIPSLPESVRAEPEDQLWDRFNQQFSIKAPNKQRPELLEISMQHSDPRLAADWVNQFVSNASMSAKANMQRDVMGEIGVRIQSMEQHIASLRGSAKQLRNDRIAILKEALDVAKAAGLDAPQVTVGRTSSTKELSEFIDGSLAYMRGARVIEAELAALEARQSDDPFIPELRTLQKQLSFLRTIDIKPDNVAVFTLDSPAALPQTPIKPKKTLILASGLILGGMLGLFAALLRNMLRVKPGAPAAQTQ